jgi:hypothetical protein
MEIQSLHAIITDGQQIALLQQNGQLHLPGAGLKKVCKKEGKAIRWLKDIVNYQLNISHPISKEEIKEVKKRTKKFVVKKTKDFVMVEKNKNMADEIPKVMTLLYVRKEDLKKGIKDSKTKYSGMELSSMAREALLKAKEKHLL